MKDKQINICGQLINISVSIVLLWLGLQIISLVIGQIISVIVVRILSKKAFFTSEINEEISKADNSSESEILKTIYPNAVKIGLTSLGGILVTRSSLFIGSLYLTLVQVASYGITIQLISVIMGLSTIYFATHQPKIVSLRVVNDKKGILEIYKRSMLFLIATYAFGGAGLIFVGPIFLELISSKTQLLPTTLIIVALIGSLLEVNVSMGGTILLTKNYVPFFKASLISGFAIVILLLLAANFSTFSLYTMIIIPIIVNVAYQAWKWPIAALVDLKN